MHRYSSTVSDCLNQNLVSSKKLRNFSQSVNPWESANPWKIKILVKSVNSCEREKDWWQKSAGNRGGRYRTVEAGAGRNPGIRWRDLPPRPPAFSRGLIPPRPAFSRPHTTATRKLRPPGLVIYRAHFNLSPGSAASNTIPHATAATLEIRASTLVISIPPKGTKVVGNWNLHAEW